MADDRPVCKHCRHHYDPEAPEPCDRTYNHCYLSFGEEDWLSIMDYGAIVSAIRRHTPRLLSHGTWIRRGAWELICDRMYYESPALCEIPLPDFLEAIEKGINLCGS